MGGMVRAEVEARLGGLDRDAAFRHVAGVEAFLRDWAPHLLDEVRGIADGAGIDARAALWLQWGMRAPEACTAFAVGPEFTGDETVYAGQTKDTGPGANERSIVLKVRPAGRPAILSFSYAGHLAQIGISSTGVSLWGMSLYVAAPGSGANPLLKRMLLECESVSAMRELADSISGENVGAFGFSDADGNVGGAGTATRPADLAGRRARLDWAREHDRLAGSGGSGAGLLPDAMPERRCAPPPSECSAGRATGRVRRGGRFCRPVGSD